MYEYVQDHFSGKKNIMKALLIHMQKKKITTKTIQKKTPKQTKTGIISTISNDP